MKSSQFEYLCGLVLAGEGERVSTVRLFVPYPLDRNICEPLHGARARISQVIYKTSKVDPLSGIGQGKESGWAPYIAVLPEDFGLPWAFTDTELEQLQVPSHVWGAVSGWDLLAAKNKISKFDS
jgi:hypothetical protein